MNTVLFAVAAFTLVTAVLVTALVVARGILVPAGPFRIALNGGKERVIQSGSGRTLLQALAEGGIFLPSACGGQGTCGACRVRLVAGGGGGLATEGVHLSASELREGWRLGCQLKVREDLEVAVPPEILAVREWACRVRSNANVATFIKELVLDLPEGETLDFRAGGYVQVLCPPHERSFRDFDIQPEYRPDWDAHDLWRHESRVTRPEVRAYSMANPPSRADIIVLNVRIALPPPGASGIPPGRVSSWLFGLRPGDPVSVTGPFGDFHVRDTTNEMVLIGGGAGMAPLRSMVLDRLEEHQDRRRMSFWYGARSLREAFYVEHFERLAAEHPDFAWCLALSEPLPGDGWEGPTGFVHQVVHDRYLADHPAPEEIEYYLCGPPLMIAACRQMLSDLGVEPENIMFDDFGA